MMFHDSDDDLKKNKKKKKQMKTDEMNMREREMWGPSASQEPA